MPILLPSLKGSCFDHPLHQGLLHATRRCSSPTSALMPKVSKKPKVHAARDMFPIDWSPPPVEFLNLRVPPAGRGTPGPSDGHPHLGKLFTSGASESYVNSLDYLLQEKRDQALEQEREQLLLQDRPQLSFLDLDEDEVPLTPEHRMLVEKFSVSPQVIPLVHPGETVFLPRHQPLPCILDHSQLKPRSHLEERFLSCPPAQQLSFLHMGLLSNLYLHIPDCPVALLRWLFQLLTWPPETSSGAFSLLWDLSVDGLFHLSDGDKQWWCPSLQEVMETFHSLGAHSPALDPSQPGGRSSRVLKNDINLSWSQQQDSPPETALDLSLSYICKFLALCALAQPTAYTDGELLGLIELLCRAGLDVGLRLLPKTDLQQLLLLLLENIHEWPGQLQPLCCTLSKVSDHHHNLLALVQFFMDVTSRSRRAGPLVESLPYLPASRIVPDVLLAVCSSFSNE
ncbi:protein FAM178B-like [Neovison vison]|uniref:protein FAM178B-like n=1 Tax=Neovison vison TaxID=452646 RepID=UPI001CF07E85|nr:protein FAM178B-like [Neogale vison]